MARTFGHEDAANASADSLDHIVTNRVIAEFLRSTDKRYIVGPKGYGKTLILLRKAIDQRRRSDGICIPSDRDLPVDRLTAAEHVGQKCFQRFSDEREAGLAWASIWKSAILLSVLHHCFHDVLANAGRDEHEPGWRSEWHKQQLTQMRDTVAELIDTRALRPRRPLVYYVDLCRKLDSAPAQQLARIRANNDKIGDLLELVDVPVYVFLDNLDDYYERDPALWFQSMYGQLRAIREIGLVHRNVHVLTTIREDVFSRFDDEMTMQYFDYVVRLKYTKREILDIFTQRIRELDADLLMEPGAVDEDPWRAFFGPLTVIENRRVGDEVEHISEYLYRHTLWRPRDMVHIGTVLLEARPSDGFDVETVRRAVNSAAHDIIRQYLAEVRPLVDPRLDIETFCRSYLTRNVLTRAEAYDAGAAFAKDYLVFDEDPTDDEREFAFAALYRLGLLGALHWDVGSHQDVQRFVRPGAGPGEDGALPESTHYFVHPVLTHFLDRGGISGDVIVGDGLPLGRKGEPA